MLSGSESETSPEDNSIEYRLTDDTYDKAYEYIYGDENSDYAIQTHDNQNVTDDKNAPDSEGNFNDNQTKTKTNRRKYLMRSGIF